MAFIIWKDEYNLGIKKIDEQHRGLADTMNEMFQMFLDKKMTDENFKAIAKKLIEYVNVHFNTEQEYFLESGYEKGEIHTSIHNQMRLRAEKLKVKYDQPDSNKETLFFELSEFLQTIWIWHINSFDKEYVPCLHAHNIY